LPRSASDRDQIIDDTVRSHPIKTGLIAIMQLIAKLWIIYVSLHKCVGLSEYQLSLLPHGDRGEGEE